MIPPPQSHSDLSRFEEELAQQRRFRGFPDQKLVPNRFSTEGLENPKNESWDFLRTFFDNVSIDALLADPPALASQLCMSSFGLDIPSLRYLLLVKGVSPDLEVKRYASTTALHCVSEIYTMADAHGRSHVFALLKVYTVTRILIHLQVLMFHVLFSYLKFIRYRTFFFLLFKICLSNFSWYSHCCFLLRYRVRRAG